MRMSLRFVLLGVLSLAHLSAPAQAHDVAAGHLRIDHPWARPTLSAAAPGAAYLVIENTGAESDRLLRVEIPEAIAATAEIHETTEQGGISQMRRLSDGIVVPAGSAVRFSPGGLHFMLLGLKDRLELGERFKGTLVFEKAGAVEVEFWVEQPSEGDQDDQPHHHH